MAKTNPSLQHVKNKILLSTYIFRSLPIEDIQKTTQEPKERQKIRNTIAFLKREKFIIQKNSLRDDKFIYLTKKGYGYVTEKILAKSDTTSQYMYKRSRVLRKSLSEHSFMNFMYVWQYISHHSENMSNAVQIYESSDMNKCKVRVYFAGTPVVISPDVIIYIPDVSSTLFRKAEFIENDNGREPYKAIFDKIIEYCVLIDKGLLSNKISHVSLKFIFRSKKRIQQLFYDTTGIAEFFKSYNSTLHVKDVRIRTIIQSLTSPNFTITVSYFDDAHMSSPYDFHSYTLSEILLSLHPSWKMYLYK